MPMLLPNTKEIIRFIPDPVSEIYLSYLNSPAAATKFHMGISIVDIYKLNMQMKTVALPSRSPSPNAIFINGSISPVRQQAQNDAKKNIMNSNLLNTLCICSGDSVAIRFPTLPLMAELNCLSVDIRVPRIIL